MNRCQKCGKELGTSEICANCISSETLSSSFDSKTDTERIIELLERIDRDLDAIRLRIQ